MNPYLVTQLRNARDNGALCREAADEIERLRMIALDLQTRTQQHAVLAEIVAHFANVDARHANPPQGPQ